MVILHDNIEVKDQLGTPDNVGPFVISKSETLIIEPMPLVIQKVAVGTHFTLDHSTNCDLDSATYELDTGLGTQNSHFIVSNPNNTFRWRFRHAEGTTSNTTDGNLDIIGFTDSGNSTATEDTTTNFRVDFTSGQVWQSLSIYKDSTSTEKVSQVKVTLTSSGTFTIQVSADGGSNWQSITEGTLTNITNLGSDLILKVTEAAASTGNISAIEAQYTLV